MGRAWSAMGSAARLAALLPVLLAAACNSSAVVERVRVVTFGDSNTDVGYAGSAPADVAHAYVSNLLPRPRADAPHDPTQLAAKIEVSWTAVRAIPIDVVNHAISGSTTGGGGFGGTDRHPLGSPHPRTIVDGITRYEAEVLGAGAPWSGGESGDAYPDGAIVRTRASAPSADDFVYVSLGTNDPADDLSSDETEANLDWMCSTWVDGGLAAEHFVLTTLAPSEVARDAIPGLNARIRNIASRQGVHVIELAPHVSDDDGLTWRSADLHIGDGVHYAEEVRAWIADELVAHMDSVTNR